MSNHEFDEIRLDQGTLEDQQDSLRLAKQKERILDKGLDPSDAAMLKGKGEFDGHPEHGEQGEPE